MSFHELIESGQPDHFWTPTWDTGEVYSGEFCEAAGTGLGAAFPAALPQGQAGPLRLGGDPQSGPARWRDLLVAIVESVKSVDKFLITFSSQPVGIGIHQRHEHAEEAIRATSRSRQAIGSRQSDGVPDHVAGGACRGGQRAASLRL